MTAIRQISFEVVPVVKGRAIEPASLTEAELERLPFEPFVIDVPELEELTGENPGRTARRAWWSVFHLLGPRGIEPEEFHVFEWDEETFTRGARIDARGILTFNAAQEA